MTWGRPVPLVTGWLVALQDAGGGLPGPSPWGGRAWLGAGLYVVVFLAALYGIWRLVRDLPAATGDAGEEES
ncbi:MAG: hypothetical protein ACYTG4_11410 [Planctomycetota bacterium]|jgi:hypothetical protein